MLWFVPLPKIDAVMASALLLVLLLLVPLSFALIALREHLSRRPLASAPCPKCGVLLGRVPRLVRVFVNSVSDNPERVERYQLHCPHCSSLLSASRSKGGWSLR